MFLPVLKNIADYINKYNTYFAESFADCILDEDGAVIARLDNGDRAAVFPRDNLGDYFYLRQKRSATLSDDGRFALSETENYGTILTSNVILVAVMKDADEMGLMGNLVNTLGKYDAFSVKPIQAEWDKEVIIMNEMKGSPPEDMQAALKNVKDQTIVAIEFILKVPMPYVRVNCLEKPCKQ